MREVGDELVALVVVMGMGRASRVLQTDRESLGTRLLVARTRLHAAGPLAGYWALARESRVTGLGPSFGTKFLYFTSTDEARALKPASFRAVLLG